LASGQIGAAASATGAVKATGTSPGRFRGAGLGVAQPAANSATTLTDKPRNRDFIELSSQMGKAACPPWQPLLSGKGAMEQISPPTRGNKARNCKAWSLWQEIRAKALARAVEILREKWTAGQMALRGGHQSPSGRPVACCIPWWSAERTQGRKRAYSFGRVRKGRNIGKL